MAQKEYQITIELLSDTLVGSAEGYSAIIDTDVVFDDLGIPYIPAKRLKGILRDNANEMLNITGHGVKINEVFGKTGETDNETPFVISNLYINDYENNRQHLANYIYGGKKIISKDDVMASFTTLRAQTAMEEGSRVAKRTSLRKIRVLRSGLSFTGTILFYEVYENLVGLACLNTRRIGTMRNRGLGEVKVSLNDNVVENALKNTLKTLKEKEATR